MAAIPPQQQQQPPNQTVSDVSKGLSAYNAASKIAGFGANAGVNDALAGLGLYQGIQQGGVQGGLTAAVSAAKLANSINTGINAAGVATGAAGDIIGGIAQGAGYIAAPLAIYSAVTQFKPGATGGDTLRGAEAGAAVGSVILPGIGTVIGGVIGAAAGAISSLFGHTDTTAASWQEMALGGGQQSFASSPAALMSAVGGLQRAPDQKFSGDTQFGGDGNKFSLALANQVSQAVASGKVPANASPQQIFQTVAQPWLKSLPGGWTQVDPKDPNRARVAAAEQEMVTDLISNYQQGKPITSFQVAGQPIPSPYQQPPAFAAAAQHGIQVQQAIQARQGVPTGASSNVQAGIVGGAAAANAVGSSIGNNNMAVVNPQTYGANPIGGALQTGVGLGSTLLGTIGSAQAGNTVGNVLSNAQNGTGVGTNTSYAGPNSTGTINSGQVQSQLSGGLNLANTGLGTIAQQQTGLASANPGQLPQNVSNAINQQAQQNSQVPQGTQAQLNQQSGLQGQVQGSQLGLMNAGQQQMTSPLTGNLQAAAQTQLNTAGQDFNTTYKNSLNSLNAALVNPTQNAEAELANTQFGRGTLGTSGGALQTQAFATGLGQAYMGNQQTAFNEATNAQNSATANAATLNAGANNNLSTANSLLANAYGQFNNTSQLNTNTANSIFGQNSSISQLGNQYGQQNVGNQITAAQLPASLAGQNIQNANQAISGASGLTGIANAGTSAALAAGTQQGQQYNQAGQVSANVLNSNGFAQTGGNGLGAIGAGLSSAFGSNGVANGIGGALGKLTGIGGTGSSTDPFAGTSLANNDASFQAYNQANAGNGVNGVDMSGIGNVDTSGFDYGQSFDPSSFDIGTI